MKKTFFIAAKEIRDFFYDKGDMSFSLILPILIFALIYGAFGGSMQFNGTAYVVNDDPNGQYSQKLIQDLQDTPGLTVETLTAADADARLSRSNILMAVFIPQGFSEKLAANQPTQITFKQRGNGGTEGQIITSMVQGSAEGISQDLQIRNRVNADLTGSGIDQQKINVVVQQVISEENSNPAVAIKETDVGSKPDPVNQFLPGIMTMFVLFAVNLTAETLVNERRRGTLERLLATRLKIGELFAGKFVAYMARGFIQTTVLLILAYAVFRIFTPVSFLEALVLALIFAAACSAIGLIIGSLSRTQNQATWISVFFTMLMVMLSGTFVAITPGTTLELLSKFSINTYANDAFRTLITQGGTLADTWTNIVVMVGVAVVGLIVSRFLFRATQGGK